MIFLLIFWGKRDMACMQVIGMFDIPDDTILYVFSFLLETKDTLSLVRTCRKGVNFGNFYGFLKSISFVKYPKYIRTFLKHINTIDRVVIYDQQNPHLWLLRFPRSIICKNCTLTEKFLPVNCNSEQVKELVFQNDFLDDRTVFKTNWALYPNLEKVVMKLWSVDTEGLENLPKLTTVYIEMHDGIFTWVNYLEKTSFRNMGENATISQISFNKQLEKLRI